MVDKSIEALKGAVAAEPMGKTAVLATVGLRGDGSGPWTYLMDVPSPDGPLMAPPPHYYALVGWGACTCVTVTGVAHRGNIPLEGLGIEFQLEPVSEPGSAGFGVRKKLILNGKLSETEVLRLRRAANFCPADQMFTKGAVELEERIEWQSGESEVLTLEDDGPATTAPPSVVPGEVRCRLLTETKTFTDAGDLYEGEVEGYADFANPPVSGRWLMMSGHVHGGWAPAPVPFAYAGVLASTVATLRRSLEDKGIPADGLFVDVRTTGGAGYTGDQTSPEARGINQDNAAAGKVRNRTAIRRIFVPGDPKSVPLELIRAALLSDPLSHGIRKGGVVLSEDVEVV